MAYDIGWAKGKQDKGQKLTSHFVGTVYISTELGS